ncbi:hypothetical protein SFUMM280S_07488 [Streptomyces fumanus]
MATGRRRYAEAAVPVRSPGAPHGRAGQTPAEVRREQTQHAGGGCRGHRRPHVECARAVQQGHTAGARHGRYGVEIRVPAHQRRQFPGHHAREDPAADGRRHAQSGGRHRPHAVLQRLDRPGDTEQTQRHGVQEPDRPGLLVRGPAEVDGQCRHEGGRRVSGVGEGDGGHVQDEISQQAATEPRGLGDHDGGEEAEVLAYGEAGSGEREGEDAQEVEAVLGRRGEQVHGGRILQSECGACGAGPAGMSPVSYVPGRRSVRVNGPRSAPVQQPRRPSAPRHGGGSGRRRHGRHRRVRG